MTLLMWTLFGVGWAVVAWFTAVAIGRLMRIDVEQPEQRARRVMRRGARWDVREAVERER